MLERRLGCWEEGWDVGKKVEMLLIWCGWDVGKLGRRLGCWDVGKKVGMLARRLGCSAKD